MSYREKLIKARLGIPALAVELQIIDRARRKAGIPGRHLYEIKKTIKRSGAEGLARQPRRKPQMPNQTPPELEARIVELTQHYFSRR